MVVVVDEVETRNARDAELRGARLAGAAAQVLTPDEARVRTYMHACTHARTHARAQKTQIDIALSTWETVAFG